MDIREISRLLQRSTPTPGSVAPSGADRNHPPREAQGSADAVQVSAQGRLLAELRRAAEAVPDVRTDRVDEVRRALQSGDLALRPETIAQALLRHGVLDDLLGQ